VDIPTLSVSTGVAPVVAPGSVGRKQVVETVEAGLGAFLQRVQVEPVFKDERFVGFQVVSIHPPDAWTEYGLLAGDVVTHVNARSIEQETEAFEVFQELRSASEIRVRLQRADEQRELVIPIVGAPEPATATSQKPITPAPGAPSKPGAPASPIP